MRDRACCRRAVTTTLSVIGGIEAESGMEVKPFTNQQGPRGGTPANQAGAASQFRQAVGPDLTAYQPRGICRARAEHGIGLVREIRVDGLM